MESYEMSREKRGKALIFNLYDESEGGPTDVDNLTKALGNYHRFECEVYTDKTYNKIHNILAREASKSYESYNCIMVIILAHGNCAGISAEDQTFKTNELWIPFTKCNTLVGKPKIFLIQACRGALRDTGVQIDSPNTSILLPRMADILIIYSSFEDYVSHITDTGSPFITVLCNELKKEKNSEREFCQILTSVNNIISLNYRFSVNNGETTKQAPTYVSSLTKALYLLPKVKVQLKDNSSVDNV